MPGPSRVTLANFRHRGHHVVYASHIVRHLLDEGVAVQLVGTQQFVQGIQHRTGFDGPVLSVAHSSKEAESQWVRFRNVRAAIREAKAWNADVLHWLTLDSYLPNVALSRANGLAMCGTLHWLDFFDASNGGHISRFRKRVKKQSLGRAVGRGIRVMVHARTFAQTLSDRYGKDQFDYVPYPIEFAERPSPISASRRAAVRAAHGVPMDATLLLLFGYTNHYKGPDLAVGCLRQLPSKFHLLIAGPEGDLTRKNLEDQARRLGVLDRVHFDLRLLPNDEMVDCFLACDIVVAPHRGGFAGQSGPLTIGAGAGRPIVCSDNVVLRETVSAFRLGEVFPAGDEAAMARAVLRVERRAPPAMIEEFWTTHSPTSFVQHVLGTYERTLSQSGSRTPSPRSRSRNARVAIVHPRIGWGGSEARALWGIEALKKDYQVSLITTELQGLDSVNEYYGTSLSRRDFEVLQVPLPGRLRRTHRFSDLRGRFVQRFCRRVAPQFDLMVSAYNLVDFGRPGLQCVADLSFLEKVRSRDQRYAPGSGWRWLSRVGGLPYRALCGAVSRSRPDNLKGHRFLTNSKWSQKILKETLGFESQVLYPPVMTEFPTVEFDRREFGFVCLGRIFPEKRYEQAIEILDQVRRRGHPVSLRIAGGLDNPVYERFLRQKVEPHKDWVTLEGKLSKQPKARLVAGMKFGISTRPLEPFGIAVAEMVRAGCIVFAPRGGGQAEIIGDDRLLFTSQADAIEKICRVLEDEGLQQVLRRLLAERAKEFSTERFQAGFRTTVQSMLNGTNGADL